jgi:hypothetical protein
MKRILVLAMLMAWLSFPGDARAQDAITIKLRKQGEGETVEVKKNSTTSSKLTATDADGKEFLNQHNIEGEILHYQETVLARKPGERATKIERAYAKTQIVKDDETSAGPLSDKIVIIVRKGDDYEFTYKSGEAVTGEAAAALAKDFAKKSNTNAELEKLTMPPGPIKAGESWKIDMAKVATLLFKDEPVEVDSAKSTGQGTLVKTYRKDGRLFGEMKIKAEMPLKSLGKDEERLVFKAGAKISVEFLIDVCVDGTSENGTFKMKRSMTGSASVAPAPGATVTVQVNAEGQETHLEAKK